MSLENDEAWRLVARRQAGLVTREQLTRLGVDRHRVRNQVRAERWREVSPTVLCTTTGTLTLEQRIWAGVLHAGAPAAAAGLTCAALWGLRRWDRAEVTVVVPKSDDIAPMDGIRFVETRRDIAVMTAAVPGPPRLQLEPALLLFAAYTRSERTAAGVLAAAVQQQLTTPAALDAWLPRMRPLRRARMFAGILVDLSGGAQSVAEIDVGRLCGERVWCRRLVRCCDGTVRGVGATPTPSGTCPTAGSSCSRWTAGSTWRPRPGGTTWPANASSSSPARW